MEETVQEDGLEFTNKDKMFVRELIKMHLGIDLTTEEDNETFQPDASNSSTETEKTYYEVQIHDMKKNLIEEVFYRHIKETTYESVKNLPYEEPDINSNVKEITCNESMPEKPVDRYQPEYELKTKTSEDLPSTLEQGDEYSDSTEVDQLTVIEMNDSHQDDTATECDNSIIISLTNSPATSSDENEDVLDILLGDDIYDGKY